VCDQPHRDQAAALLQPLTKNIDGADNALGEALGAVDQCIAITAHDHASVTAFLEKQK
jgi:hypothetical protein